MDPLEPIDYLSIDLISPAATPKKRLATAQRMVDLAVAASAALHPHLDNPRTQQAQVRALILDASPPPARQSRTVPPSLIKHPDLRALPTRGDRMPLGARQKRHRSRATRPRASGLAGSAGRLVTA